MITLTVNLKKYIKRHPDSGTLDLIKETAGGLTDVPLWVNTPPAGSVILNKLHTFQSRLRCQRYRTFVMTRRMCNTPPPSPLADKRQGIERQNEARKASHPLGSFPAALWDSHPHTAVSPHQRASKDLTSVSLHLYLIFKDKTSLTECFTLLLFQGKKSGTTCSDKREWKYAGMQGVSVAERRGICQWGRQSHTELNVEEDF